VTENPLPISQSANKVNRYILYALGEIVLVVIGILIALQINTWNQKRLASEKEKVILLELKNDLVRNTEIFEGNMNWENKMVENTEMILEHFSNEIPWHDSLGQPLSYLRHIEEFWYVSATYESLNAGGFDLIASDELRRKIIKLYDNSYKVNERRFDAITTASFQQREALFQKFFTWNQENKIVQPNVPTSQLKSSEFFNMLSLRLQFKNYHIGGNKWAKEFTKEMIDEIDVYLEER
jgi:hypothetical protein